MVTKKSRTPAVSSFPLVSGGDSEGDALTAVIRRLTSARSIAEVMEVVTHAARVIIAADGITFVFREGQFCYYAEEDAIAPLWKGRRFPMSACISGWCMEHGQRVSIPDIYQDDRVPQDAYRPTFVKSLAMVPVRQEEPIAALGAYWASLHEPTSAELDLLQTVANAAALAIAYVQLLQTQSSGAWTRVKGRLSRLPRPRSRRLNVWSPSRAFVRSERAKDLAIGTGLAAAAFVVRAALNPVVDSEVPYTIFFAAVVVAVLWRGWIAGATALVLGGVGANLILVGPLGTASLSGPRVWALFVYAIVGVILLGLTHHLQTVNQREQDLNRKLQLVRGELQHRIKNFITVVQALAVQTGRTSTDPADFDAKFTKRLRALAGAQTLLDDPKHSSAGLGLLIERTLAPFDLGDRVKVASASEMRISEDTAIGLALILNELATNALKYGSLSSADGNVLIDCECLRGRARVVWREQGGPVVSKPSRKGFGTRLIHSALGQGSGSAEIDYRPDGVRCVMEFACVTD